MGTVSPLNIFGTLCFVCSTFLYSGGDHPELELSASFSYTTLQRSVVSANGAAQNGIAYNAADETPHGLLMEAAWFKPARAGLGVGTPAFEVRAGIIEANSHTESLITREGEEAFIQGGGSGRFEPIWILMRYPLGAQGSLEASLERPYYRGESLVVTGFPLYANPSVRDFFTDTRSGSLGYRLRGEAWEAAAAFLYTRTSNHESTSASYYNGTGNIYGGQLELNRRFGAIDVSLRGSIQQGSLAITEAFQPDFDVMRYRSDFGRDLVGVRAGYPFTGGRLIGWVDGVHTETPFYDALAVGNQETELRDSGLRHSFHTMEFIFGLSGELFVSRNFALRVFGSRREGNESASFDATPVNPNSASLRIRRSGWSVGLGFRVLAQP
jgi:hypothetical protein